MKIEPQWYMSHHPDINPNKPEEVRWVGNIASKFKCLALNDKLMSDPDPQHNLLRIIFRFLEHENPMTFDIEATLLQLKLPPADCHFLRLLLRKFFNLVVEIYD